MTEGPLRQALTLPPPTQAEAAVTEERAEIINESFSKDSVKRIYTLLSERHTSIIMEKDQVSKKELFSYYILREKNDGFR